MLQYREVIAAALTHVQGAVRHPYRYGTPAAAARRQPNAIMVHFRDELAAWLAKVRYAGCRWKRVDGRTQIGMGYLGAGKVAKLEFRSREELQRPKAETRP